VIMTTYVTYYVFKKLWHITTSHTPRYEGMIYYCWLILIKPVPNTLRW
jgi:hypothetical protein